VFKLDNSLGYVVRNNSLIVFSASREIYTYKNSFVQLTLENSTQINIDYNETTEEAVFSDASLSGQHISAVLYRISTDVLNLQSIDTSIGLEISIKLLKPLKSDYY
jgi:hypothetical protein